VTSRGTSGGTPWGGTRRGPRRGLLGRLGIGAGVLALVVVIVIALWYLLAGCLHVPTPTPPGPHRPTSQPASCPDVEVLSIPGTWESRADDDPHNPHANPNSLLGYVTRPLREQFPASRLDVYTVPYVAQFSNPIAFPPDGQTSYNVSRSQGTQRADDELSRMADQCPLTSYVLVGFSQGAVIAGDIAAQVGAGKGPVSADQVLGVTLIADGRREPDQGKPVGVSPEGVGAEIALKGLRVPGITMTGPRDDGFGALNDRVRTICAPGDLICASPPRALNIFNLVSSAATLAKAQGNPVHSSYHHYDVGGQTATEWTEQWAAALVRGAPHPAHS
jgi:hypothetical protein